MIKEVTKKKNSKKTKFFPIGNVHYFFCPIIRVNIVKIQRHHWPNQCIKKRKKDATVEPRRPYLTRVFIGLTKASLA